MGRTLQNTMVNLALENACDEATYQVRPHNKQGSHRSWNQEPKRTIVLCSLHKGTTEGNKGRKC